jgi:hypothetical protein
MWLSAKGSFVDATWGGASLAPGYGDRWHLANIIKSRLDFDAGSCS